MRVNIDEIKDSGLQRDWDLTREGVDEMVRGDNAGYRAKAPAHVTAQLSKMEKRVFVSARSAASLSAPCGRCLAPVTVEVPVEFQLTFVPRDEIADEESGEHESAAGKGSFAANEVNEETYTGKVIDLDPIVREQFLLALPAYPVCGESCKGLCTVCGANLNEHECGCDRHVPDPRWAGLEKFKPKSDV
jgi:uncharacterized protein